MIYVKTKQHSTYFLTELEARLWLSKHAKDYAQAERVGNNLVWPGGTVYCVSAVQASRLLGQ